jgi:hypothetical protein
VDPERSRKLEKLRSGGVDAALGMAVFHAIGEEFDQAAERAIEERCPRLIGILGPLMRHTEQWAGLAKLMNLPN